MLVPVSSRLHGLSGYVLYTRRSAEGARILGGSRRPAVQGHAPPGNFFISDVTVKVKVKQKTWQRIRHSSCSEN